MQEFVKYRCTLNKPHQFASKNFDRLPNIEVHKFAYNVLGISYFNNVLAQTIHYNTKIVNSIITTRLVLLQTI